MALAHLNPLEDCAEFPESRDEVIFGCVRDAEYVKVLVV